MDAVDFLKTENRMCSDDLCGGDCPVDYKNNGGELTCSKFKELHPEEYVAKVEKWGKENPMVTNEMKYREVMEKTFGVEIVGRGECPPFRTGCIESCNECTKWWDEEYKKPEEMEDN